MDILDQTKKKMTATIDHLKTELRALRTNRANASMVENISVEVYGSKMRLMDVASITVPEPRQIVISPYDASNVHAIVKGIEAANVNLRGVADGNVVRVKIPEMDAQVRQEIAKQAKKKCEEAKVGIRNLRREANDFVKREKSSEDLAKKQEKGIQELTDKFCKMADDLAAEKEKEILTV